MPSPHRVLPHHAAVLAAQLEAIRRDFDAGVPLDTIRNGLPGDITREAFRAWIRQQPGFDWAERSRLQTDMRRKALIVTETAPRQGYGDAVPIVETDEMAATWTRLLAGQHYGHLHARTFRPSGRVCLPATYLPRISATAECERHALAHADWNEAAGAARRAGAPKDKGERAQDYQHRFWRARPRRSSKPKGGG